MKKKIIIGISIAVVVIGIIIGIVIINNPNRVIVKDISVFTVDNMESYGTLIYANGNVYKFSGNEKELKTTIPTEDLNQIKKNINQIKNRTETHKVENPINFHRPVNHTRYIYKNSQSIVLYSGNGIERTKNTSNCADALDELIDKYIQ